MSVTSAIVVFAVLWFLILLMVLPIGIRSQEEAGEITPGTPASAPDKPMIGRKMLWATVGAAIGLAALWSAIEFRVVTHEDIRAFAPFDA